MPDEITGGELFVVIRTAGPAQAMLPVVRQTVQGLDPAQPIYAAPARSIRHRRCV